MVPPATVSGLLARYPTVPIAGRLHRIASLLSLIHILEKVKHGEIDLICVKDFSRFSRDYIETGNYLECTFPFMGVRFISINDGYDSDDYKGTTGGLEVVMRSIIYAAYSKDLSVKTTSAKIQMMKQGKYVGGYAPYGYVCLLYTSTPR